MKYELGRSCSNWGFHDDLTGWNMFYVLYSGHGISGHCNAEKQNYAQTIDFLAGMIFQSNNIIAFSCSLIEAIIIIILIWKNFFRPLTKINITPLALLWLHFSTLAPGRVLKQKWNEWEEAMYWTKCFLQIQRCLCIKRTLWRSSKHRHNARKTWKCLEFLGIHVYVHYLGGNMKQPLVQTSYKPESATWLYHVTCGESFVTQITQLKSPWSDNVRSTAHLWDLVSSFAPTNKNTLVVWTINSIIFFLYFLPRFVSGGWGGRLVNFLLNAKNAKIGQTESASQIERLGKPMRFFSNLPNATSTSLQRQSLD